MSYQIHATGHTDTAEEETAALAGAAAALRELPGITSASFSASYDAAGQPNGATGDLLDPPDHIATAIIPPAPTTAPAATSPAAEPAAGPVATDPVSASPTGSAPGTAPDPATGLNPPPETLSEAVQATPDSSPSETPAVTESDHFGGNEGGANEGGA
jgi:hypothetical protein